MRGGRDRAAVQPQRGDRRRRAICTVRSARCAESGLLALCHETSEQLAASFHNGVASSTCDYSVPESGTIVSVFGHEHTLGKSFRLTLDPDTAHPKVLLDIPTWNFDWQMNYALASPFT